MALVFIPNSSSPRSCHLLSSAAPSPSARGVSEAVRDLQREVWELSGRRIDAVMASRGAGDGADRNNSRSTSCSDGGSSGVASPGGLPGEGVSTLSTDASEQHTTLVDGLNAARGAGGSGSALSPGSGGGPATPEGSRGRREYSQQRVIGVVCDVGVRGDVAHLTHVAAKEMGRVDIWVSE